MGGSIPGFYHCIRDRLLYFDGTKPHAVEKFEGKRHSDVYFSHRMWSQAPAKLRSSLTNLGYNFPDGNVGTPDLCVIDDVSLPLVTGSGQSIENSTIENPLGGVAVGGVLSFSKADAVLFVRPGAPPESEGGEFTGVGIDLAGPGFSEEYRPSIRATTAEVDAAQSKWLARASKRDWWMVETHL